jgi:hypothetical protein
MLRQLVCAVAVTGLIAGCSGGDDQSGDNPSGDPSAGQSSGETPAGPTAQAFDPPKLFGPLGGLKITPDKNKSTWDPQPGMFKDVALWVGLDGLHGRKLPTGDGFDAPADGTEVVRTGGSSSSPSASETASETASAGSTPGATSSPTGNGQGVNTMDATAPAPAKLNGKDVVVVAYYQKVLATGTSKDRLQIRFQWIDPAAGEVVSSTDVDVTATIGEEEVDAGLDASITTDVVVDGATGQAAVGLAPASLIGAKSGTFGVFGDPATKKGSTIPFLEPAGLSKGVLVGAIGKDNTRRTLAGVDVNTKATKFTGLKGVFYLEPVGHGDKHAYFWAESYNAKTSKESYAVYAVDMATGRPTPAPSTHDNPLTDLNCDKDQTMVVCASRGEAPNREIIGFDDATGTKKWGWGGEKSPRVVPVVGPVFHGVVYGYTPNGPALLDAATGKDIPVPSGAASPTPGGTPSQTPGNGETPSDASSPGATPSVFGDEFEAGSPAYTSDGKLIAPQAVSEYGAVSIREDFETGPLESGPVAVVLQAIG